RGALDEALFGKFVRDRIAALEHRQRTERAQPSGELCQTVSALAHALAQALDQLEREIVELLLAFAQLAPRIGQTLDPGLQILPRRIDDRGHLPKQTQLEALQL